MSNRLSKIYTRTGDKGTTGLGDGQRIAKDDCRLHVLGYVDELNSYIGLIRATLQSDGLSKFDDLLSRIQHDLFNIGGEISIPDYTLLDTEAVSRLESQLDAFNQEIPPLKDFILPAGSIATAHIHIARSICRHAERYLVSLQNRDNNITPTAQQYINRLSDWLFVFARVIVRLQHGTEVLWQNPNRDNTIE